MWTGLKRILRAGFIGFWRNAFISVASIFVMTIALLVIGATLLLNQLLGVSLQNIQEKVDINVSFVPDASEEEIAALQESIEALPEVASVRFTSREEELAEFQEKNQGDEVLMQGLEMLDENPLGASLAIQANDTTQYEQIAQFLDEQQANSGQNKIIDTVNFMETKNAIDQLTNIMIAAERFSVTTMIVLVAAAVLITFNTIRLAIYTTREEISVMRLVGAGNMFIRGPFMLQGIMYGLVAGVITLLVMYPILLSLGPATEEFFQYNILTYFQNNIFFMLGVILGTGVALGLISSVLAVSRYLRV